VFCVYVDHCLQTLMNIVTHNEFEFLPWQNLLFHIHIHVSFCVNLQINLGDRDGIVSGCFLRIQFGVPFSHNMSNFVMSCSGVYFFFKL